MKNKENLFSKGNYDIQLETLLEEKGFNDEAKSLISNIVYKIDNAYRDYFKIKNGVKLKNEIIAEIIDSVENNCNKIEIINPEKSRNKFSVDKRKKYIKSFPTEVNLLQALYYIKTPDYKKRYNIFEKSIIFVLSKGKAINGVEVIRDFDGWSWNNVIDSKYSKYYNLVYQDLILLLGENTVSDILKSENIRETLHDKIDEIYGEKKANEIVTKIEKACVLMYMKNSKKNKEEVDAYLETKKEEFYKISNKSDYISKITAENNKNLKYISKIDSILKSTNLLEKRFSKRENSGKYESVDDYIAYLNKIKENKLATIAEKKESINPFEYVKKKNSLENEVKQLNDIKVLFSRKNCIFNILVELQRKVISCYYKKIEVYDLKKELINLIYEVRYYNYLPLEDKKIKDIKALNVDLRNMQKKFINKLCENKVIETFSKDYNINYLILNYIFEAKMFNINKIQIRLKYKDKKLHMEYYDENVLENEIDINFSDDDINELSKKANKRIRIFV